MAVSRPSRRHAIFHHSREIISHANGKTIGAHPGINVVLLVGTRRLKGALFVKLRNPSDDKATFLESLWPLVEEANKPVSFTAKITKDMILITDDGIPMARLVKGTIEIMGPVKLYENKLDVLYAASAQA